MSSSLIIRPVQLTDVAAITAMYGYNVAHGTASWEYTPPDEAEMQHRMQNILNQGYPYFVAELSGNVVGYTYASSYRPRLGYRYVVEDSIYVTNALHGQGVGRSLLSRLIDACTAQGFRQMVAVIGDSQNQASIRLHQSLGFTQAGFLPNTGFKFGRWLDLVLLQRSLGEGGTTLPAGRE